MSTAATAEKRTTADESFDTAEESDFCRTSTTSFTDAVSTVSNAVAAEQHSWTSRTRSSQATHPVAGHIALAAFQQHNLKSVNLISWI